MTASESGKYSTRLGTSGWESVRYTQPERSGSCFNGCSQTNLFMSRNQHVLSTWGCQSELTALHRILECGKWRAIIGSHPD